MQMQMPVFCWVLCVCPYFFLNSLSHLTTSKQWSTFLDLFCLASLANRFKVRTTFQSNPFGHGTEVLRPQFFTSVVSHLCHYIIQLNFAIQLTVEETIRACTVQCSLSFFVHKVHEGQQRCTGAGAPWSSPTSMLHSTLAPWSIFNLYMLQVTTWHKAAGALLPAASTSWETLFKGARRKEVTLLLNPGARLGSGAQARIQRVWQRCSLGLVCLCCRPRATAVCSKGRKRWEAPKATEAAARPPPTC